MVEQGFCKAQVASSNLVRGSQSSIAQLVEQVTVNHPVPGSSPGGGVSKKHIMEIHAFSKPFCYFYVENFYNETELDLIWSELEYLYSNREKIFVSNLKSATYEGEILKDNVGIFMDDFYQNRDYSHILNFNRKLFDIYNVDTWFFKHLNVDKDGTLLSYYENGGYYKPHYDGSVATACTWLFKEPKRFIGGNFSFPEFDIEIELKNNFLICFPGQIKHSVSEVKLNPEDAGYGRWCISQFLNHR